MLLAGFRHVTRLPADIPANRLFRLAWVADSSRFLAGVRRGALRRHRPAGDRPAAAAVSLSAGHAARADARDFRIPPGHRPHIADDVQDEPAAVRRQLRSGVRPEHDRTGRLDRRVDRRVDILADRAVRAGRHRISRDLLGHPGSGRCSRRSPSAATLSSICRARSTRLPKERHDWIWGESRHSCQSAGANSPRRHKG